MELILGRDFVSSGKLSWVFALPVKVYTIDLDVVIMITRRLV